MSDAKDAHLAWAKSCGIKLETQNERKASYATWKVCEGEIRRLKEAVKGLERSNDRLQAEADKLRSSNDELKAAAVEANDLLAEQHRIMKQAN